jgi:hypothetical protein
VTGVLTSLCLSLLTTPVAIDAISGLYGVIDIHSKQACDGSVIKKRAACYSNDGSDFTVATGNVDVIIVSRYYDTQ